jgi:hypothetical protein
MVFKKFIADLAAGYRKVTGYEAGRKAGHDAGRAEGYEAGRKAGRAEFLFEIDAARQCGEDRGAHDSSLVIVITAARQTSARSYRPHVGLARQIPVGNSP